MLQEIIETKLHEAIAPVYMQVVNESYKHNVPAGAESHFKVVLVSDTFAGKRLIARHRLVNQLLAEELQHKLHALSIHTYTEYEWHTVRGTEPQTPDCMGGGDSN